jgi:hypothetical protein
MHSHNYFRPVSGSQRIPAAVILIIAMTLAACNGREAATISPAPQDGPGPTFNRISTSSQGFSIDCIPTSVTVTATITDASRISSVVLWYRVGNDQPYTPMGMDQASGNDYTGTIKASDLPVGEYGTWEFYIVAEDVSGNLGQSPLDTSVQFLPCVNH